MKPLTTDDLMQVRQLVINNWISVGVNTFGANAVVAAMPEYQNLVMSGILTVEAAQSLDPIADAYIFGFLRRRLEQQGIDVAEISLEQFHDILQRNPMPLSGAERAAIDFAKKWGGQYTRTVTERIVGRNLARLAVADTESVIAEQGNFVGEALAKVLENRWSPESLAAMLRRETEDDVTDWDRLAVTEIQNAHEHGVADDIQSSFGDDALAAKLINPDACEYCKRMYLDERGLPKIYKLKTLRANGDNIGRKKEQWRAVIGVTHPWCHCVLIYVPNGFKFNDEGELVPEKSAE